MELEKLEKEGYYHIFNRGINSENIFRDDENKNYFLRLIEKHLFKKVTILAYCLMDNHYHLIVKIESDENLATKAFSNLLNAYEKAFNKRFNRTGSLFEKHFKRIAIKDEHYLKNLVVYIHTNPENHGVVKDFRVFKFTSYHKIISKCKEKDAILNTQEVIELFDDLENFVFIH